MLRFCAREDLLVHERDAKGCSLPRPGKGAPARYVNRRLDLERHSYVAVAEPYECPEENLGEVTYLADRCRGGALWPADEATARAVGVAFVPLEFSAGVWVPTTKPKRVLKEAS